MKELDRQNIKSVPISNFLGQERITRSFCSAENLSNFGKVMCIIMPIWWGEIKCKDA